MDDEVLQRDQNHVTVLGGITNDSVQQIRMLRVDPLTGALLVLGSGGGTGVTSFNTRTGAVTLTSGDVTDALGYIPGVVGGLNTQLQYNNNGVFGSIAGAVTDGTIVSLNGAHLLDPTINGAGTGLATLTYPNTSSSVSITVPATTGTLALTSQLTSGTVTNVATDASLTGGPITTTGTLGINLANSNTFTIGQTVSMTGLGTTMTNGLFLVNPTAAASSAQQNSPSIHMQGQSFASTVPASQPLDFYLTVIPTQGSTAATGTFAIQGQVNGGTIQNSLLLSPGGQLTLAAGVTTTAVTTSTIGANFYSPSTGGTAHVSTATYLYAGATGTSLREGVYGSVSSVITVNDNYASFIVGSSVFTTAASGTHVWAANEVINPLGTVTIGTATVTNTASLYIGGASTAGTNNYAIYSASGSNVFNSSSANALTIGQNAITNPAFVIDASTVSSVTGIQIKSAALAGGVGIATISSGTNENLTVDAKGSGTIGFNTLSSTSGLITFGNATSGGGTTIFGLTRITSGNANALAVGKNGITNPVLQIDASTASVATGIMVKGAAAAGGVAITVISSGTNENVTFDAKGSGTISLATTSTGGVVLGKKVSSYNAVTTAGWGIPAVNGYGRVTAQVAANASVATYTVGAADGSFLISANILVTASVTHSFTVTCIYTDESNTSRTLTLNFSQLTGTFLTAITNVQGVGAYEGIPLHIRCKASTSITIGTTGTFTSVTYNVEGSIIQTA